MPEGTAKIEYFGSGKPLVTGVTPKMLAWNFPELLAGFQKSEQGKLVDQHAALSGLIAWATSQSEPPARPEARMIRDFIQTYRAIIEDFADRLTLTNEREFVTDKAVLNQRLAQDLWMVDKGGTPEQRELASFFVQTAEAMAKKDVRLGQEMNMAMSGARAQAAAMRLLEQEGYTIVVPDPNNTLEVETWDVLGGVDFIAVSRDGTKFLMVDTKGRRLESGKGPELAVADVAPKPQRKSHDMIRRNAFNLLRSKVRNTLSPKEYAVWTKNVDHAVTLPLEITIPTASFYLTELGAFRDKEVARTILKAIQYIK